MNIFSIIKIAYNALVVNKVRTALTVVGVVIGIASVILVYSAGEGINGLVLGQIESFGTNIIQTEIKVPSGKKGNEGEMQSAGAIATGVQITTLTLEDVEDVKKLENISNGYGAVLSQEIVGYGNETKKAFIMGVDASFIDIDKSEVEYGNFFSDLEDRALARVVVLGSGIKDKLFGNSDPIGKSIKLHKSKYKVIGVMKERGAVMTMDFDNYVYVPIRTLQKRVMGIDHLVYMVHEVINMDVADDTAEQVRELLRENHDINDPARDDFRVVTMQEMMSTLGIITDALTLLLLAIVTISLVVGGVSIMNIMYVIVSERTPEIGLRKAVGAKYSDVMWQFLIESILITSLGGVIGIIIGVSLSWLMSLGAIAYGLDWQFSVPVKAYVVALSFSTIFGIVFGVYPARKAAKLQPVDALRKE